MSFRTPNYLDEIPPDVISPGDNLSKDSPQPLKSLDTVIALYDFPGTQASHLPLNLGDTIYVLSKSETGWWDGVISNNGELQRGWFPNNYVRSVNYVQPVLNKLKSNKELDSITAANTAANVLIPSFTNLLKMNLVDSEKSTSNNSRKNSVVSFASSDDSKSIKHPGDDDSDIMHNDSKVETNYGSPHNAYQSPARPQTSRTVSDTIDPVEKIQYHDHDPNFNSFSSSATSVMDHSTPTVMNRLESFDDIKTPILPDNAKLPELKITAVDEATKLVEDYKLKTGNVPTWITKPTIEGNLVFYCSQIDIYCEELPFINLSKSDIATTQFEVPNHSVLSDSNLILDNENIRSKVNTETDDMNQKSLLFKRDSNASINSGSSVTSLYHHFNQPLYSIDGLFYYNPKDIRFWNELYDQFVYIMELTLKSVKDSNKQMFQKHFGNLNKLTTILAGSIRLSFHDLQNTKYDGSVRRKCNRINSSFSQIYISSMLQLSYLHYSTSSSSVPLFTYDLTKLNKLTSVSTNVNSLSTNSLSISTVRQIPFTPINEDTDQQAELTHIEIIELEMNNIRVNLQMMVKFFNKLTKDKKFQIKDYDGSSSENSDTDDAGIDRHNVLPQNYPRLVADEFNGGNWCNPFFESLNPIFNASGNDLKTKYHQKILIDKSSYASIKNLVHEMTTISDEALEFLDPEKQKMYYNQALLEERNTSILRLMYKYLHYSSSMIDLLESFDFTVFSLMKRFSSQNNELEIILNKYKLNQGTTDTFDQSSFSMSKSGQDHLKYSNTPSESDNHADKATSKESTTSKSSKFSSNLTFDYPVVLEFFHVKQLLHNLVTNVIISTQSLTLDDPLVFRGMKTDEAPLYYQRDHMKDPKQRATLLLTNYLLKKLEWSVDDVISTNMDTVLSKYLTEGKTFYLEVLNIVKQLIEERETIVNYATRVMHDDFNVQLLVIERNNTMESDQKDEVNNSFVTGKKTSKDTPWYLEGDVEFDLLSDMKGNIKGGTKEALICHLTHHDLFDSNFNSAFLLTFASIMPVSELINFLIARFNIEAPEGLSYDEYNTWVSKKQNPIRLRVLNVMKLLLEKYWSESYYNELVINKWLAFLQSSTVAQFSISKTLINHLGKLSRGEKVMIEREPSIPQTRTPAPLIRPSLVKKLKLLDIDYIELARQLTIREFKLYSKITKFQCLAKVWGKKSGLSENIDSITEFIKSSNQLTNFVAYMILRKDDFKKRVQIIRYFVQVAEKCRQYNNFSSMTAIISALYSSPIHRLRKTWKMVSNDTLNHLQNMNKLMNSSRNFNEYRDVLKFIGSEACVPFFGVYLSDLTFIYHGNPDTLLNRNKMINFSKRSKTADILMGLDRFKMTGYNLLLVSEIQKYLESWFDRCPTIEEQYQLSLNIEPREQNNGTASGVTTPVPRHKLTFPFSRGA